MTITMRFIIASFTALSLLTSGLVAVPAFAQTADDYSIAASGTYCPTLSVTMVRGARDASTNGQVSELQKFLADYYNFDPAELVTGYFGRITQGYVIQFQKEQGLPSFGIAGQLTRAKIANVCNQTPTIPTNNTSNGNTTTNNTTTSTVPACSITASPNPASLNSTVTLNWTSQNATYAAFVPDTSGKDNVWLPGDKLSASGSQTIVASVIGNPSVTLKVTSASGSTATCTTTFSVLSPDKTTNYVPNSNATIDASSLNTTSSNPTLTGTASTNGVYISITNSAGVGVSGSPFVSTSYGRWSYTVPQALNPGSYTVEVLGTEHKVTGVLTINAVTLPTPTISLTASPPTIGTVQSSTLSWSTSNANRCVLHYGSSEENIGVHGSKVVSPSQTTSYKIWCANDPGNGKDGPSASQTTTVTVATPSCTLTTNKSSYKYGETITFSWTSQNAAYAAFQQDTSGKDHLWLPGDKLGVSGTQSVTASVTGNPSATLLIYNNAGSSSCSATIPVTQ